MSHGAGSRRLWGRLAVAACLLPAAAAAQDTCPDSSDPFAVAVVLHGPEASLADVESVVLEGAAGKDSVSSLALRPGVGPAQANGSVFGERLGRRTRIRVFRGLRLRVPCYETVLTTEAKALPEAGTCWALIHYRLGSSSCWALRVDSEPERTPFRVLTESKERTIRLPGPETGWNVEADLPRDEYVRVEVHAPADRPEAGGKLFVTEERELGEALVPKTLDCREVVRRIAQAQLVCKNLLPCSAPIAERFLVPYLGAPPSQRALGLEGPLAASRRYWLEQATEASWLTDHVPLEDCDLPLESLTFSKAQVAQ